MRWYIAAVSCVALLSCDSVSSNTGNGPVSGLDPVLRTPAFTSMTAISGGVRIEFRNLSAPTTELQLTREQFGSVQMVASLPPSATSYDDHLDGPGLYTYKLVAFFGLQTRSQPAERSWVAQADPSSGFRVAPQRIVPAWLAIRTADGSFAMAGNIDGWDCGAPYNRSPPYYVSPGASLADGFRTERGSRAYRPGMVIDAQGRPHALYVQGPGTNLWGDGTVIHLWHDSGGWHTEGIDPDLLFYLWGTTPLATTFDGEWSLRFTISPRGTIFAAWHNLYGIWLATLRGGVWKSENVWRPPYPGQERRFASFRIIADDADEPHLIAQELEEFSLVHLRRVTGVWTEEPVPATGQVLGDFGDEEPATAYHLFSGNGSIKLVYSRFDGAESAIRLELIERTDRGWSTPRVFGTLDSTGYIVHAAQSPDGKRLALAIKGRNARTMLLWSYDSTAPETVTQKSWFWNNNGAHAVGFRQDGKLWLLDGILESVSFGACGSHTIVWLFDPAPSYDAVLIEEL